MTKSEVEQLDNQLGTARLILWNTQCPSPHPWHGYPVTTDTGDHFCDKCFTLWSTFGQVLNEPKGPR